MSSALRAKAMLADPRAEWARIAAETGDPAFLLSHYAAVLALVPAVFGFVGTSLIGVVVPGQGVARMPVFDGLFGAVFDYMETIVAVTVLGLVVNGLAPYFGARRNFDGAFKLAVYSYTPVWLAGVFLILPGLRFLVLTGCYGAYVLWVGLPPVMQTPRQQVPAYAAAIVACALVLTLIAAALQSAVFGTPGL